MIGFKLFIFKTYHSLIYLFLKSASNRIIKIAILK